MNASWVYVVSAAVTSVIISSNLSFIIVPLNECWMITSCQHICFELQVGLAVEDLFDSQKRARTCVNKDTPPLPSGWLVSFPWYHHTTRFRAGATLTISHCSWSTPPSTAELKLWTGWMKTLSGVSKEAIFSGVKKKNNNSGLNRDLKMMKVKVLNRVINTYCREWSLKFYGMLLFPQTLQYKQA